MEAGTPQASDEGVGGTSPHQLESTAARAGEEHGGDSDAEEHSALPIQDKSSGVTQDIET